MPGIVVLPSQVTDTVAQGVERVKREQQKQMLLYMVGGIIALFLIMGGTGSRRREW